MYISKFSCPLLLIVYSLLVVGCGSVPVDNEISDAISFKKTVHIPSANESIAQSPRSFKSPPKLIKQEPIETLEPKKVMIKKKVNTSVKQQLGINTADKSQIRNGDITTVETEQEGSTQKSKKVMLSKNTRKAGPSSRSVIVFKKTPIENKVTTNTDNSNTLNGKTLSDSYVVSKKLSKDVNVNKEEVVKNNSPKTIGASITLPDQNKTAAFFSKENRADDRPVNTQLINTIKDKPHEPKLSVVSDSRTVNTLQLGEENLLKEDVREKSDLLVSIEVSPSKQVDNSQVVSRSNLLLNEIELSIADDNAANEKKGWLADKASIESPEGFLDSEEAKPEKITGKTIIRGENIGSVFKDSSVKKSALLTLKDEVLDNLAKEQGFKSEVFNIVKQANNIISVESKKTIIDSLSDSIQQFLRHNWRLFVPNKEQYSNSQFSYCFKILDQMRNGQYTVQPSFKINAFDISDWEQRLNGINLVQANNVELELYTINQNGVIFNAVSTVFGADEALSTLLLDTSDNQFLGLFAYSDLDEQSVGGAGRFYSIDKIKHLQVYLIRWDSQYYSLSIEQSNNHNVMEVIPLLSSQQQQQRNCRWRS